MKKILWFAISIFLSIIIFYVIGMFINPGTDEEMIIVLLILVLIKLSVVIALLIDKTNKSKGKG